MRTHITLLGGAAAFLLAAGAAQAGTCTAEIDSLEKAIAAAGTVASSSNSTDANARAASQAEGATSSAMPGGTVPAPDEIPGQTSAQSASAAPSSEGTRTPPTAIEQPDAAGGKQANTAITGTAGAGDTPAATAPTDSDAAEAAKTTTAAGADPDAASQSLARARLLDQAGDESGCMKEVSQAKSQLGQL